MGEEVKYDLGKTQKDQNTIDMEAIVHRIVDEKTKDVTSIIHKIRALLKDETTELSDLEIDDILLQLPIVLYDSMEEQEFIGLELDMANQVHKEAYSEAYKLARGTIPERQSIADLKTRAEQLEKILFDRSYKMIKQKFEMAIETLNAVKKVQAARQQRYDLNKFSSRF